MRRLVFIFWLAWLSAQAAPFRNLGFEEANTNNVTSLPLAAGQGWGSTTDLLPGWQLFAGSRPVTRIGFNLYETQAIGEGSGLFTRGHVDFFPPDEKHALLITAPQSGSDYALVQYGEVPGDARFLTFKTSLFGIPKVYVNGVEPSSVKTVESTREPQMLYFDISAYAGKYVGLSFVVRSSSFEPRGGWLDSIGFTSVIPEPQTISLLALGGSLLAFRHWRHRRGR